MQKTAGIGGEWEVTSRWIVLIFAISAAAGLAEEISPAGRAFFEKKIRPVLVEYCYECHSANAKDVGGKLLLDTRAGWMKGGESGPALVPGKPEESVLVSALHWENDLEMPPEEPLSEMVIHDFAEWIRMGAPDPRSGAVTEVAGKSYDKDAVWSFQPVQDPQLPEVKDAVGDKAKIWVDGGFMRGTDIVKAIALGANAVGLGRLQGYALAAGGEPAMVRALEILEAEVKVALGLLGVTSLAELNASYLTETMPVPSGLNGRTVLYRMFPHLDLDDPGY